MSTQGLDGFFACVAQFVVFEAGALLMRMPARGRLLGGAVLMSISIFITAMASNCGMVIGASMLVGMVYGFVMPAGRELIVKTVDPRFQTTAIGLMDGCYSFFGGTVAMLYAGVLTETFGQQAMIWISLAVSLVPPTLVLAWCAAQRRHIRKRCCVACCAQASCENDIFGG